MKFDWKTILIRVGWAVAAEVARAVLTQNVATNAAKNAVDNHVSETNH